ncbi:D-cysteine desulfhydrase family protein [Ktedonosporobacter rubrisoli]|uniref:D-cysteine desulfhydrase family protein n=1 Tax=Ktedonosporobacter rubrisoli TaxID=2509675 RepID=A0A4P6JIB9_KTERU|nr:D-cysteine desulfhydrase family protein [Ktedonosporobacter rubrisoli]QBD74652.1 D-cysteine desulfhydrase family protein [Ktedonosporobacter rubrisoli]
MRDTLLATPRINLAELPTPLQYCPRLSAYLDGPRIYVKRDDLTGLGLGGNKVRKLEFVLAEALGQGADTIVSAGVVQSNSLRQIAAATARLGLDFHAAVITDRVPNVDPDYQESGNMLLDALFRMKAYPCSVKEDRVVFMQQLADKLRQQGKKPYIIPYGVSNVLGALGYVNCVLELVMQMQSHACSFDAIVHASGSSGTQAGLVVGAATLLPAIHILGIDIDAEPERVRRDVVHLSNELATYLRHRPASLDERIEVVAGYAGPGYGIPTPEMVEAVSLFAQLEGLVLDPVYAGKGAAGLIGLVRQGRFTKEDTVLFLHTGGMPALYAYRSAFVRHIAALSPECDI